MNETIAEVYIPDGVSKAVPTFPGQKLAFVGGHAVVTHQMHMPTVLAMPEARVQITKDWAEWLPVWVNQMPGLDDKVKATVEVMGLDPSYGKTDLSDVVFGRHPIGHQCSYCDAKRERVRKSMEKLGGIPELVTA